MTLFSIFAFEHVGSRQFTIGTATDAGLGRVYEVVDNVGYVLVLEVVQAEGGRSAVHRRRLRVDILNVVGNLHNLLTSKRVSVASRGIWSMRGRDGGRGDEAARGSKDSQARSQEWQ